MVTPDQVTTTVTVLLALFAAMVVVDKAVDVFKKWRAPTTDTMKKLAADKNRLDGHDKEIRELHDSQTVMCKGILALLEHELHNGNADQMEKARDGIMKHLQSKL